MIKNVGRIAWAFMTNQLPSDSIKAAYDLVSGNAPANERDMDKLKVFGPLAGVTFSKGAPGGPAAGELFKAREDHDFAVQQAMPEIRDMIKRGDIAKATDAMSKLDIPPGLQRYYVETTLNPQKRLQGKAGRDFWQYATPEQQERMRRALSR